MINNWGDDLIDGGRNQIHEIPEIGTTVIMPMVDFMDTARETRIQELEKEIRALTFRNDIILHSRDERIKQLEDEVARMVETVQMKDGVISGLVKLIDGSKNLILEFGNGSTHQVYRLLCGKHYGQDVCYESERASAEEFRREREARK